MTSNHSISKVIILTVGFFLAILLATLLVTDKLTVFAWLGVGALLITGVTMGRDIWMLIPLTVALNLTLMIPGRPTTVMLGQGMFVGFTVLLFLMRRLPWRVRFTELDFWLLVIGLFILQVYARNPVSVSLFGGEQIGGRPYILIALAFVTYFVLSNLNIAAQKLRWILKLTIIAYMISFILNLIGFFIPSIGMWYGAAGRGTETNMVAAEGTGTTGVGQASRIGFLGQAARDISLAVSSFRNPLKACFHPIWAPLIIISLAFAAMSGFRTQIAAVGLTYLVGIAYRGGFISVILSTVALFTTVILLALGNSLAPLPANIQRSLSFLPGTWDQKIRRDAEGSTEWRMEIWKEVMLTDRWIQNKWLGDGLGFSAQELRAQQALQDTKGGVSISGLGLHQDAILASGDYHSGPIQTIRTIGYVGLFFLLIAQIRLAVHAHRQIKRTRGTEWMPLALIVGIPLIWNPFYFVFVFGDFSRAMELLLLGSGLVKLLEYNLPLPQYRSARSGPYIPAAHKEMKPSAGTLANS